MNYLFIYMTLTTISSIKPFRPVLRAKQGMAAGCLTDSAVSTCTLEKGFL